MDEGIVGRYPGSWKGEMSVNIIIFHSVHVSKK